MTYEILLILKQGRRRKVNEHGHAAAPAPRSTAPAAWPEFTRGWREHIVSRRWTIEMVQHTFQPRSGRSATEPRRSSASTANRLKPATLSPRARFGPLELARDRPDDMVEFWLSDQPSDQLFKPGLITIDELKP
jgi:hypothetical protein